MAESEEELKSLLIELKEESEKAGLKGNIPKTKIMASSPITSWQMCSAKLLQLCPTLCNPMDCSLPGSSVHGIFQARILRWVSISSSRESSQDGRELNPRLLCLPALVGRFFTTSITWETNIWGRNGNGGRFYFLGLQKHCRR